MAGVFHIGSKTESFYWHGGKTTNLGSLPGGGSIDAYAINDSGSIVGSAQAADGKNHAFLWSGGKLTDLGTSGQASNALAINAGGQVIGYRIAASGQYLGMVWDNGKATTLPGPASFTMPMAENNAGLVVGTDDADAVTWSKGKLTDLGTGNAVAVNNNGQVLVWGAIVNKAATALLWQNGKKTALPAGVYSVAGLNDKGQVVGTYGHNGSEGFVWQNGKMTGLGAVRPVAINDLGQIITFEGGVLDNGKTTALSPTPNLSNAISDTGEVVGFSGTPISATTWQVPTTK